jgi:hypothetical protein
MKPMTATANMKPVMATANMKPMTATANMKLLIHNNFVNTPTRHDNPIIPLFKMTPFNNATFHKINNNKNKTKKSNTIAAFYTYLPQRRPVFLRTEKYASPG